MSKIAGVFIFAAGAITGTAVAKYYLDKHYEKELEDEIESVKKVLSNKDAVQSEQTEPSDNSQTTEEKKPEIEYMMDTKDYIKYANKIRKRKYKDYSNSETKTERKKGKMNDIYIVSPNEVGNIDEYEVISLTYYADGVLTDDGNEVVDDIEGTVGIKALNDFGKYEDDSVFVRNDRLKCYFEILKDTRYYTELEE